MTTERKAKWVAGTLTGLLLIAILSGVYQYQSARGYQSESERARLQHDSILATKQLLDKEIADLRIVLADEKGMNAELNERLLSAEQSLNEKQKQIERLIADNASVSSLRAQLKELRAQKDALNAEIANLKAANLQLTGENQRLSAAIATLEGDKLALQNKLLEADKSASKAGNFRVDMLKNNGKITAKAKRTRDIRVSFDLPANIAPPQQTNAEVYLVIIDPQGKMIAGKNAKKVRLDDGGEITPVQTQTVDFSRNPQTVIIDVELDAKVKAGGVYKVQLYKQDGMMGSSQIMMN